MDQKGRQKSLNAKYLEITLVVALYWAISISMVFINKFILSDKSVSFEAPLFVTFYQCLWTVIVCTLINFLGFFYPTWMTRLGFPRLHLRPSIMRRVFPLSVVFVGMITMNNLCLKYVGVAFYFVVRSLTTVFNVLLTYLVLKETTSVSAIACCAIIITGFVLGVDQESKLKVSESTNESKSSLSILGVVYGILASLFVSLNSIMTKKILPSVDGNVWMLTFYNNINGLILFAFLITAFGEIPIILSYDGIFTSKFWLLMTLSGIFGVAIGFVTGLQIKVTSPLTHNISGTAKACAQTVLAVIWYNEVKSLMWWISNILVIYGSAAYTRVKQLEMSAKHSSSKRSGDEDVLLTSYKTSNDVEGDDQSAN